MLKIVMQDESQKAQLTQIQLCFIPPKPLAMDKQHWDMF